MLSAISSLYFLNFFLSDKDAAVANLSIRMIKIFARYFIIITTQIINYTLSTIYFDLK